MRHSVVLLSIAALCSGGDPSWEQKFRAVPDPHNLRDYMQRLSARPHHVGSPYGKDNAEWILARLKSWSLDAKIETFDVLFPTPKERLVEMIEPLEFTAKLEEPAASARAVGQCGNPDSIPKLEQSLSDSHDAVKDMGAAAIVRLSQKQDVRPHPPSGQ